MTTHKLSPQQEAFAQAVANGKSLADAFREAYPRSQHWKPESVWSKASDLMKHVKVLARVEALRAELEALQLWSREDSVRALKDVIRRPDKASDIVSAVRELNAMHGYNAPQRHVVAGALISIDWEDGDANE